MSEINFDKLVSMQEEFKKVMQEKGKEILHSEFISLFKPFPTIKEVYWVQYTPFFNDGEECTFRMNDLHFKLECTDPDPEDFNYYEHVECLHQKDVRLKWEATNEALGTNKKYSYYFQDLECRKLYDSFHVEEYKALDSLDTKLHKVEDLVKLTFGDHVTVRATFNKEKDSVSFEVSEYEHD